MQQTLPKISNSYKSNLISAIFSILLFFIFYTFLISIAILLVVILGYFAVQIISAKLTGVTVLLALSLFGVGISVFYYLIKFVFVRNNEDKSTFVEVSEKEQPELFAMINDIVLKTRTQKPKKVYISPEVNASVSYNSIFWSMFLPSRKNLTIGLGLINSCTIGELKSILAHEFGHFSQRSMKVGGYVNQAEKIIFDTVYNNKSYENDLINASGHWAWKLSGTIAVGVIKVMQFLLKVFSEFLFKKHASLRREMEYHADAISTFVTNPKEQISSLLRLSLTDSALVNSVQFYINSEGKFQTKNLYENQNSLIKLFSERNNHSMINGLPKVDLEDIVRYDKSKVIIEDSYSSHPETINRVKRIQQNDTNNIPENNELAKNLIRGYDVLCEAITKKILYINKIKNTGEFIDNETFIKNYIEKNPYIEFNKIYNGYYNDHNPILEDIENLTSQNSSEDFSSFFSDEKVGFIYKKNGAQNDVMLLNYLSQKPKGIKTFQYDGNLYKLKKAQELIPTEQKNIEEYSEKIRKNDENIFKYFYQKSNEIDKKILLANYKSLSKADKEFDEYQQELSDFMSNLQFMSISLPFEQIIQHRKMLLEREEKFKEKLRSFLYNSAYSNYISEENKKLFLNYLDAKYVYFENQRYKNNETETLFNVWHEFKNTLTNGYLEIKKKLLKKQEEIEKS